MQVKDLTVEEFKFPIQKTVAETLHALLIDPDDWFGNEWATTLNLHQQELIVWKGLHQLFRSVSCEKSVGYLKILMI